MSLPLPSDVPREYVHRACGQTTIMPEEVIREYLDNPEAFATTTYCASCRKQVPDSDCQWVETGETLRSYMQHLQASHTGVASRLHLRPNGFRRILAILLFFASVVFPVDSLWRDGKLETSEQPASRLPLGSRFNRSSEPASSGVTLPWYTWTLAVVGSIFSLALYLPNWGFKRYALVCGPIVGMGALWLLSYWLTGRTKVYRFEPVFAAMAGAAPGLALWVYFVRRKLAARIRSGNW